jgi:hypothetical protein
MAKLDSMDSSSDEPEQRPPLAGSHSRAMQQSMGDWAFSGQFLPFQ